MPVRRCGRPWPRWRGASRRPPWFSSLAPCRTRERRRDVRTPSHQASIRPLGGRPSPLRRGAGRRRLETARTRARLLEAGRRPRFRICAGLDAHCDLHVRESETRFVGGERYRLFVRAAHCESNRLVSDWPCSIRPVRAAPLPSSHESALVQRGFHPRRDSGFAWFHRCERRIPTNLVGLRGVGSEADSAALPARMRDRIATRSQPKLIEAPAALALDDRWMRAARPAAASVRTDAKPARPAGSHRSSTADNAAVPFRRNPVPRCRCRRGRRVRRCSPIDSRAGETPPSIVRRG